MILQTRDVPPRVSFTLEQAGVHPLLARLLAARGVRAADELDDSLARLLPPDTLLADWPRLALDAEDAGRFLCGLRRRTARTDAGQVRVYGPEPGSFLGSAHISAAELIPDRLLSPPEVAALGRQHATSHERVAA